MKIYSLAFFLLFQFPFVCDEALEFVTSSPVADSQQKLNGNKPGVANIVFKSTDGGLTWKDISEGLPDIVGYQDNGIHLDDFFADDRGLYLSAGNWIYHNKPNSTASFWSKEILPDDHRSIAPAGKTGIFACNYVRNEFLRNTTGTSTWTSISENFKATRPQIFFETAGGTVFVGTDRRLFRSIDSGTSWKQVSPVGWVLKLVEANGVLMAASTKGIIRSTDDGQNWELVTSEDGVGIAIEKGGFAAIATGRGVRTSYDGGKTWNPVAGLPGIARISSIVQAGEYLLYSQPTGIYRSSDKGKTWRLLFPSVDSKVFKLCISGNVIYAIPRSAGC
ncbi:MAG TPA: sialidase family protein [Cyclobacteriaceae bacterium]|nr:sialidase family protein [Cyclobacteriaceae bacterium]